MNLYTRSARATPAPEIFVPQQYERELSILSTDSCFNPNDHFHDPLLDLRYLAFILRSVYQRVRNPEPNFPSCIVVPVERLIYLPWYEYPKATIHLEDYTVHCNIHEVYVQATPFRMDHRGCILGFSPTVTDLFPSGQGDIFLLFFLKEDICYPWLRSTGLRVARNKSRFRTAWIRGEIDYGKEFPGKFFRALSSIQQKFAKFVIDIEDYVINPAAGKVAICNRTALVLTSPWVSTNMATGFLAKIFGNTLLTHMVSTYPMHPSSPVPYVRDVLEYIFTVNFDSKLHCRFDPYSFQTTLFFCTTTSPEDYAQLRLSSYIPFVKLPLEFQVASYVKYPFPSCALKSLSYYSNSFAEVIGSSTELPNPHYFFELDFESAEEMNWQCSKEYRGVEYLSKEGQQKETRKDRTSM